MKEKSSLHEVLKEYALEFIYLLKKIGIRELMRLINIMGLMSTRQKLMSAMLF